ncbi:FliH/SctL family protein [Sphingomonas sp. TREG-RG-20F-R18-01]|uniref:FliH/SctL family protein n=1 Tax=Sphingomonas sp. TREG-RG-20F-R18-01 TaxID=2914982 RepID=UPI001F563E7D|nr:FliH/SctL family protein [Sphingomonas sp. TREG-RG-20F-R18-01]
MDLSFQARPFAFDRVFKTVPTHDTNPDRDATSLAIELELLQADMARRDDAHRAELARARCDGFEAGLVHARADRETALLAAIDALNAGVEAMTDDLGETRAHLARDAAELARVAATQLAAHTLALAPTAPIDAAIGRALAQVSRGTELVVRVHPDLLSDVTDRITLRQAQDRRRLNLHVEADASLAPGDARIDWDEGGLYLDRAAREAVVGNEFETLLAHHHAVPGECSVQ